MSDDEDALSDDESTRDLSALRSRDATRRKRCLDSLRKLINVWTSLDDENDYHDNKKSLAEFLPSILMLSKRCPFPDVRETCSELIEITKVKNSLHVPLQIIVFDLSYFV